MPFFSPTRLRPVKRPTPRHTFVPETRALPSALPRSRVPQAPRGTFQYAYMHTNPHSWALTLTCVGDCRVQLRFKVIPRRANAANTLKEVSVTSRRVPLRFCKASYTSASFIKGKVLRPTSANKLVEKQFTNLPDFFLKIYTVARVLDFYIYSSSLITLRTCLLAALQRTKICLLLFLLLFFFC